MSTYFGSYRKRNNYFSLSVFLFSIIYLIFTIEDLSASIQTGNIDADRSTAHISLLAVTGFLLLHFIFNRKKVRSGKPFVSLVLLLFWTSAVNIFAGVSTWTLLVQENMSVLWILSYLFFEKVALKRRGRNALKVFVRVFFAFFIGATIYYFIDMYIRFGRVPVLNVVYSAIALLPWIIVNKMKTKRTEFLIMLSIIAVTLLSMKRGAIIALVFMLLTYYFVQGAIKRNFSSFYKILVVTILLTLGFIITDKLSGGFLSARFTASELASGSGRLSQYGIIFNALKSSSPISIIIGHGCQLSVKLLGTGIHNEWLNFLFCYGIIGLVLYAMMFFGLLRQALIIKKRNPDLSLACFMMFAFYFVLSLVSTGYGGYIGLLLFGFWGYVNAEYKRSLYYS